MSDRYFNNVQLLKEKFYGHEDEYINIGKYLHKESRLKLNKELRYVSTLLFNSDNFIDDKKFIGNKKLRITLPKINPNKSTYKNLRCVSKLKSMDDVIKMYELNVGGSTVDKLYGEYDVWRHIYNMSDKSVVPFHFCNKDEFLPILSDHDITIFIEVNENINFDLMVDLYEWDSEKYKIAREYSIMTTQYNECYVNGVILKEILTFNHVCTHIVLKFIGNEIEDISFNFDDEILHVPNICIEKYNDCYIIPLTKSMDADTLKKFGINFGSMKKSIINIKFKDPVNDPVNDIGTIFALNHQNIRIMSGKLGMAYSK